MKNYLLISHIVISILLIMVILSQEKGVGLSSVFGGGGEFYKSKRGIDRIFFMATIILSVLFIGTSLAFIFIR